MELLGELERSLGSFWPEKRVVRHDQYGQTKALLSKSKTKILDQLDFCEQERALWDSLWPFVTKIAQGQGIAGTRAAPQQSGPNDTRIGSRL